MVERRCPIYSYFSFFIIAKKNQQQNKTKNCDTFTCDMREFSASLTADLHAGY